MKKIKVQYINTTDPYSNLWGMSKAELIEIIKDNDEVIDRLNKKY